LQFLLSFYAVIHEWSIVVIFVSKVRNLFLTWIPRYKHDVKWYCITQANDFWNPYITWHTYLWPLNPYTCLFTSPVSIYFFTNMFCMHEQHFAQVPNIKCLNKCGSLNNITQIFLTLGNTTHYYNFGHLPNWIWSWASKRNKCIIFLKLSQILEH
jgi:hypothetical protein